MPGQRVSADRTSLGYHCFYGRTRRLGVLGGGMVRDPFRSVFHRRRWRRLRRIILPLAVVGGMLPPWRCIMTRRLDLSGRPGTLAGCDHTFGFATMGRRRSACP